MLKWTCFFFFLIVNMLLFISPVRANQCLAHISDHLINPDTLWLDECYLTDKDMPEIVAYLERHPKITQLYLLNNKIGDNGVMLLAKNKTLKMVELRNNLVTLKGAKALARSTIHMLDLQGNKFKAAHLAFLNKQASSRIKPRQTEAIILA